MNWDLFFLLLMSFAVLDVGWVKGTCVFNSEFGFTLDCGFKKSTLFRVRNLGGVKGYVGLGFSLGDELGFAQALSNEEDQNKRSATGVNDAQIEPRARGDTEVTGRSHSSRNPLLAWATAGGMPGTIPGPLTGSLPGTIPGSVLPGAMPGLPLGLPAPPPTVPPFKPLGGSNPKNVTVPPFSALPPSIARIPVINSRPPVKPAPLLYQNAMQMANRRFQVVVPNITDLPLRSNIIVGTVVEPVQEPQRPAPNTLSLRTLNERTVRPSPSTVAGIDVTSPSPLLMGHSVQSLAQASNISVEALAAALRLREQQLLASVTSTTTSTSTTTTTTTTTTTPPPPTRPPTIRPRYPLVGPNRVMNAPKEYYPVSYDKNYDDNFTSKVELPDTSFSCGDQKHFPGLYADEDLGCMVFHVCAFTDDGMVMKSFLCPESTLFDQSILKCNWWFYVDCKASRKLYDSNIPISKSYQLMKALAFFSAYKNQTSNVT